MSKFNQNYYNDSYKYGYIQRLPTYNYTGYYHQHSLDNNLYINNCREKLQLQLSNH